ncbi:serpin family protein, partial [Miniimonas arenae]|uniref:serpin family protein n=1 Tax=Miniimonas arenae TaxID=676201 RepID=UPI0028AD7BE2
GDPTLAAADELPAAPLLHLADRVVLDDELDVEPDFLAALARGYDAGVDTTDLGVDAAKAVLDEWVNRETGGLVRSSAITPHPDLRVVLQDAIVLAARWRVPFEPSDTAPAAFASGTGVVDVDTLHGTAEADWTAHDVDGWTSVRLPYVEGFVADLVLPPAGTDPADVPLDVLGGLRTGAEATDLAQGRPIGVAVPVLDLEPGPLDLLPALDAVGLGELSGSPDLRGITTREDLFLAQAAQQARLTLDESGTVAAAVTELAADSTAAQVQPADALVVTFDRPFLLRVADAETGLTLFLAAVREPSAG